LLTGKYVELPDTKKYTEAVFQAALPGRYGIAFMAIP
jgi:hypothetical protein